MRLLPNLLALTLTVFATGCGNQSVNLTSPLTHPPLIEAVSVPVVIHYSNELRNHSCTGDEGYIEFSWTFEMGQPSIDMFDLIFSGMFRDAEFVNSAFDFSSETTHHNTIELRLIDFNGCEASWPITGGRTRIWVKYEATLRTANKGVVATWAGAGRAGPGVEYGSWGEIGYLEALTQKAMRRAAADFIVNFKNDPSIQAWILAQ